MAITNIKLKPINALIFASIFLLTACGGSGSSSNEGPSPTPTPTPTPIPTDLKDAVTQEYDISIDDSIIFSLPNAQSVALFDGTSGNLYALENTQDPQIQVDVVGTNDEKVDGAIDIIRAHARKRVIKQPTVPPTEMGEFFTPIMVDVLVGGATVFVVNVDRFEKI